MELETDLGFRSIEFIEIQFCKYFSRWYGEWCKFIFRIRKTTPQTSTGINSQSKLRPRALLQVEAGLTDGQFRFAKRSFQNRYENSNCQIKSNYESNPSRQSGLHRKAWESENRARSVFRSPVPDRDVHAQLRRHECPPLRAHSA